MTIQLNTLQVGYVSTCRLLYGSGLIGWWDNHPTNLFTAIQLNTLQWDMCPLAVLIAIQLNTLQVGYVSTCRLLHSHSIEYVASGICVHLQIIVWFRFNRLVDNHPTNLL